MQKNLQEFDARYQRHLDAHRTFMDSAQKGDILLISSRFEKRWGVTGETNSNGALPMYFDHKNHQYNQSNAYKAWKESLRNVIDNASGRGIRTIIFTSFPKITGSVPMCVSDPQWFNDFPWCNDAKWDFSRIAIADHAKPVNSLLRVLADTNNEVYLFDQFNALCPQHADKCKPWYTKDGIHLSRIGSVALYEHLKRFMFAKGLLSQ